MHASHCNLGIKCEFNLRRSPKVAIVFTMLATKTCSCVALHNAGSSHAASYNYDDIIVI